MSSNRIEGVEVDKSRVGTLIFGKPAFQDRDEEEVSGYRDALKLIHERGASLPISEATIMKLHKLSRGKIWDAGKYKDKDIDAGLQGIRKPTGPSQEPARREDRSRRSGHRPSGRRVQRVGYSAGLSGGQR